MSIQGDSPSADKDKPRWTHGSASLQGWEPHSRWAIIFLRAEWAMAWAAYWLSNLALFKILEYLGKLSIVVAVIFYFREVPTRRKQAQYDAWRIIAANEGKPWDTGRIQALQDLNAKQGPLNDVNLQKTYLRGIKLPRASLAKADLSGADLSRADLSRADLSGANLFGANLRGADLRGAILSGANLIGADLRGAILGGANLFETDLSGANLFGANLIGADLRWAILSGKANLRRADLSEANLRWANLRCAHLNGAKLIRADLRKADLCGANLFGAKLSGADLRGADLCDADLGGEADFSNASLEQRQIDLAVSDQSTKLPHGLTQPLKRQRTRYPPQCCKTVVDP